jgi:hypothetical protein
LNSDRRKLLLILSAGSLKAAFNEGHGSGSLISCELSVTISTGERSCGVFSGDFDCVAGISSSSSSFSLSDFCSSEVPPTEFFASLMKRNPYDSRVPF